MVSHRGKAAQTCTLNMETVTATNMQMDAMRLRASRRVARREATSAGTGLLAWANSASIYGCRLKWTQDRSAAMSKSSENFGPSTRFVISASSRSPRNSTRVSAVTRAVA